MAQWQRKFEKWQYAKTPVNADEAESILSRVFGERLRVVSGTSHRYQISVPELKSNLKYQFGHITIPLTGGQAIKAPYLQKAYEAALLLGLYGGGQERKADDEDDN